LKSAGGTGDSTPSIRRDLDDGRCSWWLSSAPPMRYQDFIAEVRDLISDAEFICALSVDHHDGAFRAWRHKAESLVDEAKAHGYRLPGPFNSSSRTYRAMWRGAKKDDDVKALTKDLRDSMIELREKYGVPALQMGSVQSPAPIAAELPAPDKVTVVWLARHVPVGLWITAVVILLTVFLLGAAVGPTATGRAITAAIKAVIPGH
jgi:hypothetical protein